MVNSEPSQQKKTPRRTQAERSETMRKKIIDATISCLETNGYAGTTMSRIIDAAGVSRGAPIHHFPNKAAMIAEAADELRRRVSRNLAKSIDGLDSSEDKVHEMVSRAWKNVFNSSDQTALLELLLVCRHDEQLTHILREIWETSYKVVGAAANNYLEAKKDGVNVAEMVVLTQWLLRGMAEDTQMITNPAIFDRYIKIWCDMLSVQLKD